MKGERGREDSERRRGRKSWRRSWGDRAGREEGEEKGEDCPSLGRTATRCSLRSQSTKGNEVYEEDRMGYERLREGEGGHRSDGATEIDSIAPEGGGE